MPIRHTVWKVGSQPQRLIESALASESLLEEMIVAAPELLSGDWMLIGRQEDTGFRGRIDLLAMEPDGSLVLIELKRGRTPREVVAQALDYASWVQDLDAAAVAAIYGRFKPGRSLADDFRERFGTVLDEETLNQSHRIVVVASALDDATERIVKYLSNRDLAINVLFFQVFAHGGEQLISRAWLIDPARAQTNVNVSVAGEKEPWNGEFYCSMGEGRSRSWQDAAELGFISAGGGAWYSKTLQQLSPGDRVWVNVPRKGYVGVGRVTGLVQPASTFTVHTAKGEAPVLQAVKHGTYHRELIDDPERCEYFVPMKWLHTVPVEHAVNEVGLFGNQNTVCKPTAAKWRTTVERLKAVFTGFERE